MAELGRDEGRDAGAVPLTTAPAADILRVARLAPARGSGTPEVDRADRDVDFMKDLRERIWALVEMKVSWWLSHTCV